MSDVLTYKCPNCAAPLAFDIQSQQWNCAFCDSHFVLEDLRETLGVDAQVDVYDHEASHVYSCPSCGGRVITEKNTTATFCIYCHNPTVIAANLSGEYRPAYLIPFKVEKAAAISALQKLCRQYPLLPSDFRNYVAKGEVSGLYVPYWLYSTDVQGDMQARAHRISSWTSGNYRYTKTDTYQVIRKASMSFHHIPADASTKMDDALMESMEPFDYTCLVPFEMGYLSGHFAESYDVDKGQASPRAMSRMREATREMLSSTISGYTSYDISSLEARHTALEISYALLPVWTVMTEYQGKRYLFAMNGQTGKITGHLPIAWNRAALIAGILFSALTALAALGGFLL